MSSYAPAALLVGTYSIYSWEVKQRSFVVVTLQTPKLYFMPTLWTDLRIFVRKLFVCFFQYVCWIWGSCKFKKCLLLKNTVIVEVRYRFFLGFHPLTFHKTWHFDGFCFILPLQILHNLLADRPAPRGAAGGAGGGPPCKSKKTTLKIIFKKSNYYFIYCSSEQFPKK